MFYQFFIEASSEDKTKTAKGLLLLFIVGFLPIFVGIEIKHFVIDLPWLINAEISNPVRFTYFYCFVVTYAVYRHYIMNKSLADCFKAKCIQNFLNNRIFGIQFVNKYIFSCKDVYSTRFEESEESFSVLVCGYSESDDLIPSETFTITVLPNSKCSISFHAPDFTQPFTEKKDEWGAYFHICNIQEDDSSRYLSAENVNLRPGRVTKILTAWSYIFSLKTLLQDVRFIDFYAPVILNLGLVNYIAISSII